MASLLYFLMGFLYLEIMEEQNHFMTVVVASGAGDTSRTGKSLMTHMWQWVFDGKKTDEGTMSISEAAVYKQLDSGTPVYSKFYY